MRTISLLLETIEYELFISYTPNNEQVSLQEEGS
jgi:hypothetical protein